MLDNCGKTKCPPVSQLPKNPSRTKQKSHAIMEKLRTCKWKDTSRSCDEMIISFHFTGNEIQPPQVTDGPKATPQNTYSNPRFWTLSSSPSLPRGAASSCQMGGSPCCYQLQCLSRGESHTGTRSLDSVSPALTWGPNVQLSSADFLRDSASSLPLTPTPLYKHPTVPRGVAL